MPPRLCLVIALLFLLPNSCANRSLAQGERQRPDRPELVLQSGHVDRVAAVAVSRDGRTIASGGWDGAIKIWDARTGEVLRSIRAATELMPVAFLPNGRVVGGSTANTLKVWDIATGAVVRTFAGHSTLVLAAAVSPDGRTLASAAEDGEVRLWNLHDGTLRAGIANPRVFIQSLAFSPDGRTLAGGADNDIRVWNADTGQLVRELKGHTKLVSAIQYSPDGRLLLSGSFDRTARLWDAATGAPRRQLTGSSEEIKSVAFSPDGKTIATGGGFFAERAELKLWDTATGAHKQDLRGHTGFVSDLAFTPDGATLVSSSWDRSIRLWASSAGKPGRTLHGLSAWMKQVAYSPDGQVIAAASQDGTVKLWDAATGALKLTLTGHTGEVNSLAWSPGGTSLVSGGGDMALKVWDAASGTLLRELRGQQGVINCVAFSPDGAVIASGGWRDGIRLWDAATGALRELIPVEDSWINSLAFSPDGALLAYGGGGQKVTIRNLKQRAVQNTLRGFSAEVSSLAFSPDGALLATGNADKTLMLWDYTRDRTRTLSNNEDWSVAIDWSPDGKRLASAGMGDEVKVRDIESGEIVHRLKAGFDWIWSVDFSKDGKTLIAGAFDNTIHLWNTGNGRLLATLLPMPDIAREVGARAIEIGAKNAATPANEWFALTPEGYFDGSANAPSFIRWRVGDNLYPAERYLRRFRRPGQVRKALRGESLTESPFTALDEPPLLRFVAFRYDAASSAASPGVTVTLEAQSRRPVRAADVTLLVNGRPLPSGAARAVPRNAGTAKSPGTGAKAIEMGAKAVELGGRPLVMQGPSANSGLPMKQRFSFQVPLPQGAREVQLSAVAFDEAGLGSNRAGMAPLRRPGQKTVVGDLYVLSVGISRYRNADGRGFRNLKFAAHDATQMALRLKREGAPLYRKVELYSGAALTNEKATLANVRAGIRWLQKKVRPGQVDTVVVFLSGHGLSDAGGKYYFPAHEFDAAQKSGTSISGDELQRELGGKLRAKNVYLFVDSCHSGALAGARTSDLNFEIAASGVHMMASSGSTQLSYEHEGWQHGAFTLALLNSLSRRDLSRNGIIHFDALSFAVPGEIARLLTTARQNPYSQEPVVPMAARSLNAPVAVAK